MLCCAALYERICTLPFPPSFSYACMLGFSGGGVADAAAIDGVVVLLCRGRNLRRIREEREVG